MMVVRRREGKSSTPVSRTCLEYLGPGDVLVLNTTKVIPAKTWGKATGTRSSFSSSRKSKGTSGKSSAVRPRESGQADRSSFRPVWRPRSSESVARGKRLPAFLVGRCLEAASKDRVCAASSLHQAAESGGRDSGSYDLETLPDCVRPPRRGDRRAHGRPSLHSGGPDIAREKKGVIVCPVNLDVGQATFQPVEAESVEDHRMLSEDIRHRPRMRPRSINQAK